MRIAVQISTNKLIEMQSTATEGALIANAVAQGYSADDVQELVITEQEWAETWRPEEPTRYSPDAVMTYLLTDNSSPIKNVDFMALSETVRGLAISYSMRFVDHANEADALTTYRTAAQVCDAMAGNSVCTTLAEAVIAKAIELGANISQEVQNALIAKLIELKANIN